MFLRGRFAAIPLAFGAMTALAASEEIGVHAAVVFDRTLEQAQAPFHPTPGSEVALPVSWNLVAEEAPPALEIEFPASARQGPSLWWVGDLRFEIEPVHSSVLGEFRVDCGTNDQSAFLMLFERKEATGLEVRLHDLVDGSRTVPIVDARVSVRYRNYLRDQGVLPGTTSFSCRSEGNSDIGVAAVLLTPPSSIYATNHSPTPVSLEIDVRAGKRADVHRIAFRVASEDERRLGTVNVSARTKNAAVTVRGNRTQVFANATDRISGEILIETAEPGRHEVEILAATAYNSPKVSVLVERREQRWPMRSIVTLGIGIAVMAVGLRSLIFRRRPLSSEGQPKQRTGTAAGRRP